MPFSTIIDSLGHSLGRGLSPLRRWRDSVTGELGRRGRARVVLIGQTEDEREPGSAITAPLLPTLYARSPAPLVHSVRRSREPRAA